MYAMVQANQLIIRIARKEDAGNIANLVNIAYRSKLINKGWTNESELVSGNRIDEKSVESLIDRSLSTVLLASGNDNAIACAHLLKQNDSVYLGMLSVDPEVQGTGIGKHVLCEIEDYAWNELAAESIIIDVITQRIELISFYQRRGYQIYGSPKEYPVHLNVGKPLRNDLTIQQLVKYR